MPIANSVRAAIGRVMASWDDNPVTPRPAGERAGVCSVEVPDMDAAVAALASRRIATFPELQYMRLDLHAFNTEQDVQRFVDCFALLRK